MNKILEYVISAKDKTGAAVSSALARVKSFASSVAQNLANVKAGFDMLAGFARSFSSAFAVAIKEAFKFEKATADFKVLLDSADAARDHIARLRQFASATPLTFDDLSRASKLLLSFGANVKDVMPYLKTLGDISMGNTQKFQGLALVFAQVQSACKLMGQDLLQMVNQGFNPLTVIAQETGKSVAELKDLMSEGAISFEMVAEAMRVATSAGGLCNGAMEEASKTGEGLMSTLSDKWADAVRTFGNRFTDAAKGGIQTLISRLADLAESGTLDEWADNAARALGRFGAKLSETVQGVRALGSAAEWLWKKSGASDLWHGANSIVQGTGALIGTLVGGGSLRDAARAYDEASAEEIAKGFYGGKIFRGYAPEEAKRAPRRARPAAEAPPPAQTAAPTQKQGASLAQMLEKATEGERRKQEEAEKKLARERAAEAEKLRRQEEAARLKLERDLHNARVRLLTDELQRRKSLQSGAEAQLAAAQANETQAWGWYRDKDALKAQLAEERANDEAEKRFEKDFARLKSKNLDWRRAAEYCSGGMRALSLEETAVKRVALAREQRAAAEDYARQTAEGVAQMAQTLEELNATIQEGSIE